MLYFKPIRFDNESVHHGLPVLEPARGLDPWCSDQKDRGLWGREWMTGRQRTALQFSEESHINTEHLALLGQYTRKRKPNARLWKQLSRNWQKVSEACRL